MLNIVFQRARVIRHANTMSAQILGWKSLYKSGRMLLRSRTTLQFPVKSSAGMIVLSKNKMERPAFVAMNLQAREIDMMLSLLRI